MKLSAFGVKQENLNQEKNILILAMHVLRVHFYSINISKNTYIDKKNLFKILLRIKGKFNKRKPGLKENTNHFYHYTNFLKKMKKALV